MKTRKFGGCVVLAFAAAACGGEEASPTGESVSVQYMPEVTETSPLAATFDDAAAKWNIPIDVLKALAYDQTGLDPAQGEVEFEGQPEPWGYFALRGEELDRAASLSGRSVEEIRGDDSASIDAAASLLDAYAKEAGIADADRANVEAWEPALRKFGALDDEMAQEMSRDVFAHLANGIAVPMIDGTTLVINRYAKLAGLATDPNFATTGEGLGQAGALWRPSPNHNSRSGSRVELVVIHTCEGAYTGCVSWLRNTAAGASAHYVVKESGGEISQLVDENRRAWHVAASYRKSLNGDRLAHRQGQSTNTFSVGIEHGGFARQSSWPASQIAASVALVRGITSRHSIPRDRYHIVAHGRLQPENRTDPGPNWPWTSYIASIAGGGGGGGGGGSTPPPPSSTIITVDNTTSGRFRASATWDSSAWAAGKVGTNYRYRNPQATSDLAEYKFNIASAGRYEVFARVPGNGYSTDQPYVINHRGGRTIVHRNISARGASWVSLGTFDFAAQDDWVVQISCWTNGDGYLIADAVKMEKR